MHKFISAVAAVLISAIVSACGAAPAVYEDNYRSSESGSGGLTTSLFASDTALVDNESAGKILSSRIVLPASSKLVFFQVQNRNNTSRYYGYYYWKVEEYYDLESRYLSALKSRIEKNPRITEVLPLPSFLQPEKLTLSNLREAALRLQGNMILVYKVQSDIYEKFHFFKPDDIRAFATVEALLLDTRTGLVPFSTIITKKHGASYSGDGDEIKKEVTRKAEVDCTVAALTQLSEEVDAYFRGIEKKE